MSGLKLRPLQRKDLPRSRSTHDSLRIPVFLDGLMRRVCDIHKEDDELCWLEGCQGEPTRIEDLMIHENTIPINRLEDKIRKLKSEKKKIENAIEDFGKELWTLKKLTHEPECAE